MTPRSAKLDKNLKGEIPAELKNLRGNIPANREEQRMLYGCKKA